ncbi:uncharacterized protein LDX57_011905 [Aspergillus melleus]|uniref:uncharacterized protein n=1 Tax=Aspergillus melleus TaxID=138277 RepID=UPI001E8CEBC6|nr:uncharacterized protein LDX57_011905 [Aspergillus melleus]KAH8434267.1 hypothetical protein LDX57_011905 [Aspergillus melleus]
MAKADGDSTIPREEEKYWRTRCDIIKTLKEKRSHLQGFLQNDQFHFGTVVAASGLIERPLKANHAKIPDMSVSIIDWALIKPGNRSIGSNKVPSPIGPIPLNLFDAPRLENKQVLAKVGCASGYTEGLYSGLKVAVISRHTLNGQEQEVKTWEHSITPASFEDEFAVSPHEIIKYGDSGSLVYGLVGRLVAMCFGGSYSGDILYFTYIGDLIESIRETRGDSEVRFRD